MSASREHELVDIASALKRIWARVFELDAVELDDNFFDLGGDSLTALEIAGLLLAEGWVCDPADVFERMTITEIASTISRIKFDAEDAEALATERDTRLSIEDKNQIVHLLETAGSWSRPHG